MKRMFYLIPFVLCIAIVFVLVCSPVSAARPDESEFHELDAGGEIINSGYYAVYGKTTPGADGRANMWCWIEYENGDLQDRVTAYIESDVGVVTTARIRTLAWYTDAEIGATTTNTEQTFSSIPTPPGNINVTIYAPNAFLTKGTAAHLVKYPTRGEWCCGTTIIVR